MSSSGPNCQLTGKESTVADFKRLFENLTKKNAATPESQNGALIFSELDPSKTGIYNIVYLDIDGVCWVEPEHVPHPKHATLLANVELCNLIMAYSDLILKQFGMRNPIDFLRVICFNPEHMSRIKSLCDKYKAKIVVTSDWRKFRTVKHLQAIFDLWGLGQYVIGKTPLDTERCHAVGIASWQANNSYLAFVILDDQHIGPLYEKFPFRFVHCPDKIGFNEACHLKAEILFDAQITPIQNTSIQNTIVEELKEIVFLLKPSSQLTAEPTTMEVYQGENEEPSSRSRQAPCLP